MDARPRHDARATLFETERGRVARCACCGQLELRFGNALMTLAPEDLDGILAALVAAEQEATELARPTSTLTLGESGCGWVFDADEVAELHRLVAGTRLLLALTRESPDARARDLPDFTA